ncbi:phage distal tail protein [Micromonospora sonchi]|uniref:phage distal tail protein n=1 Tax=Micromonospora sonchi TaxID=1763543 RepID=UPI00166CE5A5|nr:phage tail domain-containing protein [Micromonospora sonchi]
MAEVDPGEYVPTWIGPAGDEWPLNPPGRELFTLNSVTGYGITPGEVVTRPRSWGGVTVTGVKIRQRTLTWPVRLRAQTHMEFLTKWRALAESFAATWHDGPGLFRLTRPDGSAREVLAYYQSGWDGEPGQGQTEDTPVLTLLCPDGFWRDSEPVTWERRYGTNLDYLNPFPSVSSGDVLGDTEMWNPGSVPVYPTWQITGPLTAITATNHTTGETFTLTYALAPGEFINITTRPGRVTGPAGQMLGGALTRPGSTLWGLRRGLNHLQFEASGGSEGTSVTLTFRPQYHTA